MPRLPVPMTPHRMIRQAVGNGFQCTEFIQTANAEIEEHSHAESMLVFMLGGSACESVGRQTYELLPASVLFRPAFVPHTHHYGNHGVRCLVVELETAILEFIPDISPRYQDYTHTREVNVFSSGLHLWQELQRHDSVQPVAMEEIVLASLGTFFQKQPIRDAAPPAWLRKARELIHECFLERLTLSEIARCSDVHPLYLADMFRKFYGSSIGKTIRTLRLKYGIDQLVRTERSLADIALETGFFDQAHFSNFIRRHTALTPSQLRKLSKNTLPPAT